MIAFTVLISFFPTQFSLGQELKGTLTKTQANQVVIKCKSDCATICRKTLAYVNERGTQYASVSQAIQDCLQVCEMSKDLTRPGSKLHCTANQLCIDACYQCIAACEAINDKKLKNCINACRTLAIELSYDQLNQLTRDIDTLIGLHQKWKLTNSTKSQELKARLAKIEEEQQSLRATSSPSLEAYKKLVDEAASFKFELKRELQSSVGGTNLTGPLP
ncbi:MAG: hypothetical protein K2X27_03265 [Candidatus Obscuribacterales bacterium]|nr:hypothetical protein [Candidatus Obscuribacterales bacterium]